MRVYCLLVGVLAAAACVNAYADDEPSNTGGSTYLGAVRLQPDADSRLADQYGHWGLAGGFGWRFSRHVALELDLLYTGQQADMPAVGVPGSTPALDTMRAHIYVYGFAGRVRVIYPVGNFEPYASVGVGRYTAEISDFDEPYHAFFPADVTKIRTERATGVQTALGVDVLLSARSALRFEYRWLRLEADFGPEFGGAINVGGGMPMLALRVGM